MVLTAFILNVSESVSARYLFGICGLRAAFSHFSIWEGEARERLSPLSETSKKKQSRSYEYPLVRPSRSQTLRGSTGIFIPTGLKKKLSKREVYNKGGNMCVPGGHFNFHGRGEVKENPISAVSYFLRTMYERENSPASTKHTLPQDPPTHAG